MINKKNFGIGAVVLMIIVAFTPVITGMKLSTKKADAKEDPNFETILLSNEQLNEIKELIKNVKDEQAKKQIQDIVDRVTTESNELDTKELQKVLFEFYETGKNIVLPTPENIIEEALSNPSSGVTMKTSNPPERSTTYEAPFDSCFHWDEKDVDETTYASSGCNRYSGAIGARAGAIVGGARGEARQEISFYVGKTKTVTIEGHVETFGGKLWVPPAAVASSHITCLIDNDVDNLYFMNDITPAFGWDWWIGEFLWFIGVLAGYGGTDVDEAMKYLDLINSLSELKNTMDDVDNVQTHKIDCPFTAKKGLHTVAIGVRADAAAMIFGTAHVARVGRVTNIRIIGYCRPDIPILRGPYYAEVGDLCEFSAEAEDFYEDDIQYKFDWGDGKVTDWTELVPSGTRVSRTHSYQQADTYTVKAKARDIDLLESDWCTETIIIRENHPPDDPICRYKWHGFPDLYGILYFCSTDPDGGMIEYGVDWSGGTTVDDWYGPYCEGQEGGVRTDDKGTVNVIAKDDHGALSGWVSLNIKAKNKQVTSQLFFQLLQRFLKF